MSASKNQKRPVLGALYRHYKGKKYRVHSICRHSESVEELVYYEALYENELGRLWVRPLDMFMEKILIDGREVDRFELIGDGTTVSAE